MRTIRKKKGTRRRSGQALVRKAPKLLGIQAAPWWQWWAPALVVLAASLVVYWPTLDNGFINWDDFDYLTKKDYVAESGGLPRIWDLDEKHNQYYPMVFSSFWLEHKVTLWLKGERARESYENVFHLDRGFEPWIHHLTNMVLHAVDAALVVWALRLLGVCPWVAWLTAALFAVHPINVASVAWAAERKNVLSGLFFLLALIFYLRNTRRPRWLTYGVCMAFYVLALLSKSATMTLPGTAIICDRLIEGRWSLRSWTRVAPMLVLGAISAMITKTTEVANAGATMVPLEPALRPLAAAGAIWFYIGKVLVPYHYPGVYPRWDLQGSWPVFAAAIAALPAAGFVAWKLRRRISGHALWGLGHYLASLFPMLGLVAFNYTQFSFVADHFVYLPSIGLFLCIALVVDLARRRLGPGRWPTAVLTVLACAALAGLGTSSFRHNREVWKDGESFWVYTLKLNSGCWPGHYNLGNIYRRRAQRLRQDGATDEVTRLVTEAAECYHRATAARPDLHQAFAARGDMLRNLGDLDGAIAAYSRAVSLKPRRPNFRDKLARLLARTGQDDAAAEQYRAIIDNNFRRTRAHRRLLVKAHLRLAGHLVRQGDLASIDEAIELYERVPLLGPSAESAKAAERRVEAARLVRERLLTRSQAE